jgi:hypothetical protein
VPVEMRADALTARGDWSRKMVNGIMTFSILRWPLVGKVNVALWVRRKKRLLRRKMRRGWFAEVASAADGFVASLGGGYYNCRVTVHSAAGFIRLRARSKAGLVGLWEESLHLSVRHGRQRGVRAAAARPAFVPEPGQERARRRMERAQHTVCSFLDHMPSPHHGARERLVDVQAGCPTMERRAPGRGGGSLQVVLWQRQCVRGHRGAQSGRQRRLRMQRVLHWRRLLRLRARLRCRRRCVSDDDNSWNFFKVKLIVRC